jgi:hypothetical protein
MKKVCVLILALGAVAFLLNGCLTCEKKEYTFELTGKNSGKLTIKYINIMSVMDDSTDVSSDDFDELVNSYLYGDQIESDYPDATNIQKNIYEENGMLCAVVTMEFATLDGVKLFQYDKKSPFMMSLGNALDTETFFESNGTFGGENMPVVFWPSTLKTLSLMTQVTSPDETTLSLVDQYRAWKEQ